MDTKKTVFINGGSRGIGAAMVRLFAENGYKVAFSYYHSEKEAISLSGAVGALAVRADSASAEDIRAAVDTILERFGAIDVLVNNAALSFVGLYTDISSMWGQVGASCEVHYSATKAALIGLTKALAKELGPSGITVNAIAPGVIETEMNAHLSNADKAALAEETPLMRIGTPEDVARCALFLAGEGGDFITGQVLCPNGGFVM